MRKQLLLVIFFQLVIRYLAAQTNIPTTAMGPASATPKALPAYNPTPAANYLRTLTPVMPTTDSSRITINAWADTVNISTQYIDALNRPLQTVIKQASPLKHDYISPDVYDEFGRVVNAYLPYAQQIGNTNDGKFKTNQFTNDSSFYKAIFPNESINYSQVTYDANPLQRTVKSTAPGNSWTGGNVGISNTWRANAATDSVRLWTIAISTENDVPSTSIAYAAGSLSIQETTDEKGVKIVTYKDEVGRTVLTKQQVSATPTTGHYGWLCTYYVYDEMNHLRVIIPPKATDALNNATVNWNLSGNPTIKTGLCFSYFYDARGRVTIKYIPGKGKNYFAYDLYDRLVMTQDSNLRQTNQWAFVLYDGESRPWRKGVITSSLVKDTIIAQASASTAYPTLSGTYTITSETYFDDYSWISGLAPNSTLVTTNINSANFNTTYNSYPDYAQPITQSSRIRGAVTGSKRLILGTSVYIYNVPLYDDHGRVIQVKETNYTGGTDILTKQYSFIGRTLRTQLYHYKGPNNPQGHTLLTKYTYDHVGRIKTIVKNIDGLGDKTITSNTYNELGQLAYKTLGSGIDSVNFTYNIRGWLLGINKNYVDNASSVKNYFGEDVFYDYGFTNSQLNGVIAGVKWKAGGDTTARAYGFSYDNANRLTLADFSQNVKGTSNWNNLTVDYTVSGLTYDGGGNILTMKQRGLEIGSSVTIDSLTYQCYANSNQLQKVSDAITDPTPLGDFKDTTYSGDDYAYDANGNIVKDYNRHMHTPANGNGAVYNLLDKPDSLVIAGKATLYYYYDASGVLLDKKVNDYSSGSLVVKNYIYIDGFVYLNDTLQYVSTEEGRIRYAKKRNNVNGTTYYAFEYDYYLRDHLNNVRSVLTEGKDTATYVATMETADSATVQALFSNVYTPVNTVYPKPAAFDANSSNKNVARLNSSTGSKTGPSIVLKVMAGDQVQINTYAYFAGTVQTPVSDNTLLTDLLNTLVGGITNQSGGKIASGNATQLSNAVSPNILSFLNNRSYNSSLPKAYLNWVLLDDQFKYVAGNMGALQVQAGSSKQALVAPLQTIAKNGYLYIYLSNQSPQDVYFDDLTVTQTTGPLVQEQSYYPFGLQMAGISDRAMLKLNSKNKFDGGVELEEDYGVNLYSTFYRNYDPQIGRFGGVDILSERSIGMSVYGFGNNNPINFNDPSGALSSLAEQTTARHNSWSGEDFLFGGQDVDIDGGTDYLDNGGGGGGGGGGWSCLQAPPTDYTNYWNTTLTSLVNGIPTPGYTSTGTIPYYNYSNISTSGIFETPNDDGFFTDQDGQHYNYIGTTYKTSYTLDNLESVDWKGVGTASLGILGGLSEWAVGGVGEWLSGGTGTPLTVPLFVDGGARIGGGFAKLMASISGHKDVADAIPSNILAAVGKTIDMASGKSFYNYGYGQAIGGGLNDVASFVATGGTGGALNDLMENPSIITSGMYINSYIGYGDGLYEDFSPLNH